MRLKGHDYSQNGMYFVTICTNGNRSLFWDSDVGANCVRPPLSKAGIIIEEEISTLASAYPDVCVDNYVIMPNHIHMIIVISQPPVSIERTQFAPTLSRVVKQYKGAITKKIGTSIWQRSYHDHIIRNAEDYSRIFEYINSNPAKWADDRYFAAS